MLLENYEFLVERAELKCSKTLVSHLTSTKLQWVDISLRFGAFYTQTQGLHSAISGAFRLRIYLRFEPLLHFYKAHISTY
jgi:hypothetical protein